MMKRMDYIIPIVADWFFGAIIYRKKFYGGKAYPARVLYDDYLNNGKYFQKRPVAREIFSKSLQQLIGVENYMHAMYDLELDMRVRWYLLPEIDEMRRLEFEFLGKLPSLATGEKCATL